MGDSADFVVAWQPGFRTDYNRQMPAILRSARNTWLILVGGTGVVVALLSVMAFVGGAWVLGAAMVLIGFAPLAATLWWRRRHPARVLEPMDPTAFAFVGDEVRTTAFSGRYEFLDRAAATWKISQTSLELVRVRGVAVVRLTGPDGQRCPYRVATLAVPAETILAEFEARRALAGAEVTER